MDEPDMDRQQQRASRLADQQADAARHVLLCARVAMTDSAAEELSWQQLTHLHSHVTILQGRQRPCQRQVACSSVGQQSHKHFAIMDASPVKGVETLQNAPMC